MLFLVDGSLILSKLLPKLAAFLHGLGMRATLLLLDLLHLFSGVKQVRRQRLLREDAVWTVLVLRVLLNLRRLLPVLCHEEALLLVLLNLPMVPFLVVLTALIKRFLLLLGHVAPNLGRFGEGRLLVHAVVVLQLAKHLLVEVDPRRRRFLGFGRFDHDAWGVSRGCSARLH